MTEDLLEMMVMVKGMKDFLGIFASYIKRNMAAVAVVFISVGIFLMVLSLYSLPLEAVGYAALLTSLFLSGIGIIKFGTFYKKHRTLKKIFKSITISDYQLPVSWDLIENDYQELIKIVDQNRIRVIDEKNKAFTDIMDYYTVWAHQIKNPIAAMRLLLQSEQSEKNSELLDELFKVEQYVEMVLQYLRLESISSDLMIQRYSLDDLVRQAIRKYAKFFIRKKIKLNYPGLNCQVLTDEKWLVFVVEQILSNALKYTNEGEITIYMDNTLPDTLVIADTGIGIEQEDLPRVFEKGFTGYNGRLDKKSTGIGLYLCKQILNKLSHTIMIESSTGEGTRVKIGLNAGNPVVD